MVLFLVFSEITILSSILSPAFLIGINPTGSQGHRMYWDTDVCEDLS